VVSALRVLWAWVPPSASPYHHYAAFGLGRPPAASHPITPAGFKYFLPKKVLRKVFRGKFVNALEQAFQDGLLRFEGNLKLLAKPKIFAAWLRPLYRKYWVVYLKRPFGGPEYVLQYLGRYTHRVAISNQRLLHRWPSHLPLARFRCPQQTEVALSTGRRVLEPLSVAPASTRLRAYPALWLLGHPTAR